MSSNRSNRKKASQVKRIRSIRRRIAGGRVWRKIYGSFKADFLILLTAFIVWIAAYEYHAVGRIDLKDADRSFTWDSSYDTGSYMDIFPRLENGVYELKDDETGAVLVSFRPFFHIREILIIFLVVFLVQIILHWLSYPIESASVKRILKPLDDLASKADELLSYDLYGDKYHLIEDKINSLEPWDDELISLGDEDLLGIERAMNSLIRRIWENNAQQARFVNDASHELRTPISVIQGYVNMLARWGREDEKVLDESITAIQNEADNMKHLVEQLLFLARGDSGRTKLDLKNVELNSLMREVYEESLMIDEEHVYKFNEAPEELFVNADEGMLKQALRILVDNASKYTEKGGEIRLSTGKRENGNTFLRVQDSGIGMKEGDLKRMFDRFYRADEARSFDGTGLGLSIAKWIVDKHGGFFDIVSSEGLGTRIDVVLSNSDSSDQSQREEDPSA